MKIMSKEPTFERRETEAGFTLLEAICAITILTIGLISTAAAISSALKFSQISKNAGTAKSIVMSTIEQIHSLRDSRRLRFAQIRNQDSAAPQLNPSDAAFSGFTNKTDFMPVAVFPGDDGVYGTPDDFTAEGQKFVEGYTRNIVIDDPVPNFKQITVTVRYPGANGQTYELNCVSYLNNDIKR